MRGWGTQGQKLRQKQQSTSRTACWSLSGHAILFPNRARTFHSARSNPFSVCEPSSDLVLTCVPAEKARSVPSLLPSSHRHDAKAADRRRDSLSPCISFLHFPIDFTSLPLPLFKRQVVLPQGRIPSRRRSRHGEAPLHFRSNVNACQKSFTAPASSQEPDRRAIVWLCGAELRR